ncbi:Sesquiterpene cyclase hepA [Cladobotryum mycophilum]|uniref:Terpene synthase n=1 Tax=Cladobotryum mycophilum TaxID=491253 RepID=A0ABR0T445_9HYPO
MATKVNDQISLPTLNLIDVQDDSSKPAIRDLKARDTLVAFMRGSHVTIPDLLEPIKHWHQAVHPEVDRVDVEIRKTLDLIFTSPKDAKRLEKSKGTRLDLFAGSWWCDVRYEALVIAAYITIWVFTWDDETDSDEFSSLIEDFDKSSAFRRETLAYLEASFNLDRQHELEKISTNPIITNFAPIGKALARHGNQRQVDRFMNELRFFVMMTEEEQAFQMTSHMPTVEEYIQRRMGSSALRVGLSFTEYAHNIDLPEEVMQSDAMTALWRETNIIFSINNDIISIKKEIEKSQVDSLIPLLTMQLGSVQAAIDEAASIVRLAVHRFEAAEKELLDGSAPGLRDDLVKFITCCKHSCTGNILWSLSTPRYKLACGTSMEGGVRVVL